MSSAGHRLFSLKPGLVISVPMDTLVDLLIPLALALALALESFICLLQDALADGAGITGKFRLCLEGGGGAAVVVNLDLVGGLKAEEGGVLVGSPIGSGAGEVELVVAQRFLGPFHGLGLLLLMLLVVAAMIIIVVVLRELSFANSLVGQILAKEVADGIVRSGHGEHGGRERESEKEREAVNGVQLGVEIGKSPRFRLARR